jgi:hypothetical protein
VDYYISGIQTKSTTKKICQYCIKRRERRVQKNSREIISNIPKKGFTIVVEDESEFVHYRYLTGVAHTSL